jgi:hypothetical protein
MVKTRTSCGGAEHGSTWFDPRVEERPTDRQEHPLPIRFALHRGAIPLVEQSHGILVLQCPELFADKADAHVDLVQP